LKKIGTYIGGEGIENLLVNMVLEKKTFKKTKNPKIPFYVSSFEKKVQFGIVQSMMIYEV
jgi:hypothetical protein